MRTFILALGCAAVMCPQTRAFAGVVTEPLPGDLRLLSKKGIDAVYAVDLPEAKKNFELALQKYPAHPFPHFGMAMTKWAELEYLEDESSPKLAEEYASLTDRAIDVAKDWLDEHPYDANAYMCLGGMYGLRARLAVMQHRWFKAYFDGKKAISNTRKSLKLDPEMYDSYLGLGMYEYYTGTLPGVIKLLAKLVMGGDAAKGIEYLRLCKEKGYFNSVAAELLLIEIFTDPAGRFRDPGTAVKWSAELRKIYPQHPQMHFVQIVSLYEDGLYGEAEKEALEYLERVHNGEIPAYRRRYLPRILSALGGIYLAEGKRDKAREYFRKAGDTIKEDASAHPARWAVWALVREGNVMDLNGQREKAEALYEKARSYDDEWGFREYIDHYRKKPFSAEELPGPLPPP